MSISKLKTNRSNKTSTQVVANTCVFDRMARTAGRFFGLVLESGERINAQYRNQTDKYLMIYDRNQARNRRILKTQVSKTTV